MPMKWQIIAINDMFNKIIAILYSFDKRVSMMPLNSSQIAPNELYRSAFLITIILNFKGR